MSGYWNPERETLPAGELRDLQNEKLRRQVSHGYHNAPIVRELWDEAGVTPDDVHTVEDLAAAPVFRKDEARRRQLENGEPFGGRLCVPRREFAESGGMVGTSSGTTGASTNVYLTDHDQAVMAEALARTYWEMGLRPNDVFLALGVPYHLNHVGSVHAAGRIGAVPTQVYHSPHEAARVAHVLESLEPTACWFVSPPLVAAMNDYMAANDVDPAELWAPMEGLVFGGEPLIEPVRAELEAEWGVEIYSMGGGLEPGWGPAERGEKGGWLQVASDHFYVEARDPETGERVPDGERGELVVTPLTYEGMSHLCWAHDDVVEIKRGPFDDGRTGARIRMLGRVDDMVSVDGEELLPFDVLPLTHGIEGMPDNLFQFYADSEEALRLRIGYDEDEAADPAALGSEVRDRIETDLGVPVEVVDMMPEDELRQLGPEHKIPRVTEG